MRPVILITLCFLSLDSYGQKETAVKNIHFKIVEHINGNPYRKRIESIDTSGFAGNKIDLYFFRKHFYKPYYLPDQFVDRRYKNETIIKPDNGDTEIAKQTISTAYDSLSRIINYANSGCVVCNFLPYSYQFSYNHAGQVESITNLINLKERFNIYYDEKGNIIRLDYLVPGKLQEQIIRID